jgi:hypothetical protein
MATFRKRSGSWQAIVKKKEFGQIARTFDTKAEAEVGAWWGSQIPSSRFARRKMPFGRDRRLKPGELD